MKRLVDSRIHTHPLVSRFRTEDYLLSFILVTRARLMVDERSLLLEEDDQPGLRSPTYFDDGLGTSIVFGGDFAPYKQRTDLTLAGRAQVPGGRRANALVVTLGLGAWRKSLDIIGDQSWTRGLEVGVSTPEPFETMQLRLENAFGGIGSAYNPWGKGFGRLAEEPGATLPACNVHPAGERHARWDAQITPAGLGPLPETTLPRAALRGTYDEAWSYKRSPLPPEDFRWEFYNAAPPDQQFFPYLQGDETLHFENLHPDHPVFTTTLPGFRLRLLLRRNGQARAPQIEEIKTVLDSVHVDTDAMTIDLGWRAVTKTSHPEAEDISHYYVGMEALDEPAKPLVDHVRAFELFIDPPPPSPPPPPPPPEPDDEERAEGELEIVTTLKNTVRELSLPDALKGAVDKATTSREINKLLDDAMNLFEQGLAKARSGQAPPK
jgi:hypothetical protein